MIILLSNEELDEYSRANYNLIFGFCLSRLGNRPDAEDATQETFLIFSQKAHLIENSHLTAWLFATAHNLVLKEYRRRLMNKDRSYHFDEDMENISRRARVIEDDFVDYYIHKYIDEVYSRLSEKEKEAFDLFSDGTLKTGQIAQLLGIEPHACSMRKKRLWEKCRDIMEEILFF